MARTKALIIYGAESKILRRIVVPTNDDAELSLHGPLSGEAALFVELGQHNVDGCKRAIFQATGVYPPSGRCCVVGKAGFVIEVCAADPILDRHPNGDLMLDENAATGDRYAGVAQ